MPDVPLTSVKRGAGATKRLYNRFNVAGWTPVAINDISSAVVSLSGALTANALVDLVNESGSAGEISQFSIATNDTTARTIRVVVTIDGTVIFDRTSSSITSLGGLFLAGSNSVVNPATLPSIKYSNSKRIQYASNVSETGKLTTYLAFQDVT